MTNTEHGPADGDRRLTPADVHNARFSSAGMLHPGYSGADVDRFKHRVAEELARLHAEKAELRDHVNALRAQIQEAPVPVAPSDQAVRLLATAQQTADNYVAEAEEFSRQMATDARVQYEELLRRARESAGAIIQTAQEAAAKVAAGGAAVTAAEPGAERPAEQLEEQVAYLRAFAQATRTQLKAYLEALLADVEKEWGRADPAAVQQPPLRAPSQRTAPPAETGTSAPTNVAREMPMSDSTSEHPVVPTEGGATALGQRGGR
jgi:DivIVA domain-containing protein